MTRVINATAKRGDLKTEVTVRHTEKNAYTPDTKKELEKFKNELYEFLKNRGYNYSDIKIS